MYWSKVIIASLVASPSFARQQRLGAHVEMVGEGIVFDVPLSTQFSSRSLEVDQQQDGADAYGLEPINYDELSNEKTEEGADAIEHEDVSRYYL